MNEKFQKCFENVITLQKLFIMRDIADDIHTLISKKDLTEDQIKRIKRILEE